MAEDKNQTPSFDGDIEFLLTAYANGYFPMAEHRDDPRIYWFYPEQRGILPLDTFRISSKLKRALRKQPFVITVDKAFADVIRACAERDETWINDTIITLYCELYEQGYAHSVECWQDKKLVGGLYGVALGGTFFGESMFSRVTDASKIALAHLVELLRDSGYTLLDTQYVNEHLKQFGVQEIPRKDYLERLQKALAIQPENIWKC